jgi:hypothetical protein
MKNLVSEAVAMQDKLLEYRYNMRKGLANQVCVVFNSNPTISKPLCHIPYMFIKPTISMPYAIHVYLTHHLYKKCVFNPPFRPLRTSAASPCRANPPLM